VTEATQRGINDGTVWLCSGPKEQISVSAHRGAANIKGAKRPRDDTLTISYEALRPSERVQTAARLVSANPA
jgi:hypothetical protein